MAAIPSTPEEMYTPPPLSPPPIENCISYRNSIHPNRNRILYPS
ncbi:hypothetical protein T06_11231 [Trichinella sp. T6]|nr:hypothetical protein T06_11231 [Trichinella sp. T6]